MQHTLAVSVRPIWSTVTDMFATELVVENGRFMSDSILIELSHSRWGVRASVAIASMVEARPSASSPWKRRM